MTVSRIFIHHLIRLTNTNLSQYCFLCIKTPVLGFHVKHQVDLINKTDLFLTHQVAFGTGLVLLNQKTSVIKSVMYSCHALGTIAKSVCIVCQVCATRIYYIFRTI